MAFVPVLRWPLLPLTFIGWGLFFLPLVASAEFAPVTFWGRDPDINTSFCLEMLLKDTENIILFYQ